MGAKAHVFVDDVDVPELSASDRHHLERVLRLRDGDEVTACDGAGRWRPCRLATGGAVAPWGDVRADPPPAPPVAVAFAVAKGERTDWAVQKLTELGADRIVPFLAARSVVRWEGDTAARHVERLRRIAREAASQSRRTWLPVVEDVVTFDELVSRPGAVVADRGGAPLSSVASRGIVLVGPEGGWAPEELAADMPRVALGPHVLRTETAAVAAGALLSALRAGLV